MRPSRTSSGAQGELDLELAHTSLAWCPYIEQMCYHVRIFSDWPAHPARPGPIVTFGIGKRVLMAEAILDPTDIAVDYETLVQRIIRTMRASDDPLTLDDLAEMAGLSPYHFARVFRSVTGAPPVEFQTSLRFVRAKELLLTSPASVTDICFEVGYGSLGTFSRRFKQMVGVTPAEFRALPDTVDRLALDDPITRNGWLGGGSIARIEGDIVAPGLDARIYVGLFPDNRPGGRPVVGQMLPEPGPFSLPNVPVGVWYLMAAALPRDGDPVAQLLPNGIHVGGSGTVEIARGDERLRRLIMMRPILPTDPPVLTALPALLL
jgi:AraC-like DNA-binding protein